MKEVKRIKLPVFTWNVYIVYTDNIFEARKSYNGILGKDEASESSYKNTDGMCSWFDEEHITYVFIKPDSYIGTIAHECCHVVWRIFRKIGAEFEDEIFAYHVGYLTQEIKDFINSTERKKNDTAKQRTQGGNQVQHSAERGTERNKEDHQREPDSNSNGQSGIGQEPRMCSNSSGFSV